MRRWGGRFSRADGTVAVLWANAVVFAAGLALARSPEALVGMPTEVLYTLGMSDALAVFRELRIETVVTSCFVHASLLHLAFNLYVWVQVGPPVERVIGTARMVTLCLLGGVAGSLASATVGWAAETPRTSEGLSGCLCAVLGAALVVGLRRDGFGSPLARSMLRWLGLFVAIQWIASALGFDARSDHAAHGAAFSAGVLLGWLWAGGAAVAPPDRRAVAAFALVVASCFAVAGYRARRDPFATLGARERCDLASILVRARECDSARAALDAATRLLPEQPSVMALEGEWRRACPSRGPGPPSS